MTSKQILESGHSLHFTDAAELISQQKPADFPTNQAQADALMQKSFEDNCKSYATLWIDQLGECYHPDTLQNVIIPALINICKEGADVGHPYG